MLCPPDCVRVRVSLPCPSSLSHAVQHTFIVWHPSWAAAHAAAVAELRAAGMGEAISPCFATDESSTHLFPHGWVS